MISRENLEKLLAELLPNEKISCFTLAWIQTDSKVTEESIRKVYQLLKDYGFKNEEIASRAYLLAEEADVLEAKRYLITNNLVAL